MPQNPNVKRPGANPPRSIDGFSPPPTPTSQPNFPAVGMTLSSYNHDPFEKMKQSSSPSAKPSSTSRLRRFKGAFTLKKVALTLLALVILTGGWLGWKFAYNAHKLFGGSVLSVFTTSKLKGEGSGRVNILVAGNSADDPGHNGGNLTDSILILSVDTKNNTAFMLSVPRDLYVAIPGHGHQKINAVYPDGNASHFSQSGYPNGGMGLLEKTLHQNFGITLNYYALIDYGALKDAVDDVGGITVTINSSDKRGLYDPDIDYATHPHTPLVKLTNGKHTLTGEQALDLARARGDAYGSYGFANSDFDRTANQRMMLLALKSKATSAGVITNPVKVGELFDALGSNVKTDMKLNEVHRLFDLTKNINPNSIQSVGLNNASGQNLLMNYQAPNGESALVPTSGLDDYSVIKQFLQRLTSNNPVVKEGAMVVVLNGTTTSGLAATQATRIESKNIVVTHVADANTFTQTTTQIIDNSGGKKPATKQQLEQLYGTTHITTVNPYSTKYKADFIIVVGTDQLPKQSSQ